MSFTVPEAELVYQASRAGGPGGQHVNKASTRVEVVWDVAGSLTLTQAQRNRIMTKLANRIDRAGRLRIASERYRSQARNKADATARLRELVARALHRPKRRKKTTPPKQAVEQRLREKRERGERKQRRRPPGPED